MSTVFFQCFEAQHVPLPPVSKCLSRRRYQEFHFFRFHHGQHLIIHGKTDSSFLFFCQTELMSPIRDCSVNTELTYMMNCLEQQFCIHRLSIEVNGTFAFVLLQDPTTESTGTSEYRMTSFFESLYYFVGCTIPLSILIVGIGIPFLFRLWTQKRPMSLRESHRVFLDIFGIRNTILIIVSTQGH